MPELPEVETTARLVRPHLLGRRLTAARVLWLRTLGGATVRGVDRRAKWVVLDLGAAGALLVHLRMTGRLVVEPAEDDAGPWLRVGLGLDDGRELRFLDVRKFGRVLHVAEPSAVFAALGPEPLGPEFTPEALLAGLRARRRALKPLLLDQGFIAGLGNIYVDEALFEVGVHPLRPANRVSPDEAGRLRRASIAILERAIAHRGTTFSDYRTVNGEVGAYAARLSVYAHEGEPCPRCGTPIEKLVVGQRGTHVCPQCQPKPRTRRRRR